MTRFSEVKGFSALAPYLSSGSLNKFCFVDTTVLFAQTYPLDPLHDDVEPIFELMTRTRTSIFTNINVRAEFLENHRRALISECLIDLLEEDGEKIEMSLAEKLKSHRTSFRKKVADQKSGKMEIQQIKLFRRLLSSCDTPNGNSWEIFCRDRLSGQIERVWDAVEQESSLNLISLRSRDTDLVVAKPNWRDAVSIIGRHGLASADAMILNMFLCTKIPVLLTADMEMAEVAAMESQGQKLIFVPDSLIIN